MVIGRYSLYKYPKEKDYKRRDDRQGYQCCIQSITADMWSIAKCEFQQRQHIHTSSWQVFNRWQPLVRVKSVWHHNYLENVDESAKCEEYQSSSVSFYGKPGGVKACGMGMEAKGTIGGRGGLLEPMTVVSADAHFPSIVLSLWTLDIAHCHWAMCPVQLGLLTAEF